MRPLNPVASAVVAGPPLTPSIGGGFNDLGTEDGEEPSAGWFPGEPNNAGPPALPPPYQSDLLSEEGTEATAAYLSGGPPGGPGQPVPEPETVILFTMAGGVLLVTLWRRGLLTPDALGINIRA